MGPSTMTLNGPDHNAPTDSGRCGLAFRWMGTDVTATGASMPVLLRPQQQKVAALPTCSSPDVTAAVLIIGNEILSGRTNDANLNTLALWLGGLGVRLREARVVADDRDDIIAAVNALRARHTYVFTTGGIGPTHDDITADCMATAFDVPLIRNAEAAARLELHYDPGQLNEARLKMADTPQGATLIDNPMSAAPGFQIGNVFVLAGVPSIMKAMIDGLAPRIVGGARLLTRTISCALGEGTLATDLGGIQARYSNLEIGSYPYFRMGVVGVSLVLRGTDAEELAAATTAVCALVKGHGAVPTVTEGQDG